ncbi:MAG: ABC-type transport auxiliary lipoprotein family protein [Rhodocyclaceae bacterium]|nr:ABC-type transport auxiliary lipoprotein family protein [Rhodocyclaceae bacterium]
MRSTAILFLLLLLAGCAGTVRQPEVARLDLGLATPVWKPSSLALDGVDIQAPSWLAGTAMQYRQLNADPHRRLAYAESRWAAPPAELIERALSRNTPGAAGCRLSIELDELIQVFESPQASHVLLEARAALLAPRSRIAIARKSFAISQPAAGADSRGGAAATSAAVRQLGDALNAWLTPLAARCDKGNP